MLRRRCCRRRRGRRGRRGRGAGPVGQHEAEEARPRVWPDGLLQAGHGARRGIRGPVSARPLRPVLAPVPGSAHAAVPVQALGRARSGVCGGAAQAHPARGLAVVAPPHAPGPCGLRQGHCRLRQVWRRGHGAGPHDRRVARQRLWPVGAPPGRGWAAGQRVRPPRALARLQHGHHPRRACAHDLQGRERRVAGDAPRPDPHAPAHHRPAQAPRHPRRRRHRRGRARRHGHEHHQVDCQARLPVPRAPRRRQVGPRPASGSGPDLHHRPDELPAAALVHGVARVVWHHRPLAPVRSQQAEAEGLPQWRQGHGQVSRRQRGTVLLHVAAGVQGAQRAPSRALPDPRHAGAAPRDSHPGHPARPGPRAHPAAQRLCRPLAHRLPARVAVQHVDAPRDGRHQPQVSQARRRGARVGAALVQERRQGGRPAHVGNGVARRGERHLPHL